MKLLVLFYAFLFSVGLVSAQTVEVTKKNRPIKSNTAMGHLIELAGKTETAEAALIKYLKDTGKTRSTADYISVTSPLMGGTTYEGKVLYAVAEGDDTKAKVWVGLDTAEWRGYDVEEVLDNVNKLVYQFGIKFYRDQVQKEIDESQQAFDATERQKARLVNQNKDLNLKLGNNEQERIHLEKAVEVNKLEKVVLLQRIENNKKAQDSVANAGLQIKKVLEAQKEKQKKIN